MTEQQLRQRLLDDGLTQDEAESEVSAWAEDAYDRDQDYKAEQHFESKS
jgi:hypothetical protein